MKLNQAHRTLLLFLSIFTVSGWVQADAAVVLDQNYSCGEYVRDYQGRNGPGRSAYEGAMHYAEGFLSAVNIGNELRHDPQIAQNTRRAYRGLYLYNYCINHPLSPFFSSLNSFVHAYWGGWPAAHVQPAASRTQEGTVTRGQQAEQITTEQRAATSQRALQNRWLAEIKNRVQNNWKQPDIYSPGSSCRVELKQDRAGNILSVSISQCIGGAGFIQSIEDAIRRSDPLPKASNDQVFQKMLIFDFKPQG